MRRQRRSITDIICENCKYLPTKRSRNKRKPIPTEIASILAIILNMRGQLSLAWACSACHDEIDRRTHNLDNKDARLYHLEGVIRTQAILLKEGKIKP
ncbi:unnamed protein product [Escherichia coli]|nr:unnamed protein product [Escherichia coli]